MTFGRLVLRMLKVLLLCLALLEYQLPGINASICIPEYVKLEPECGREDLRAEAEPRTLEKEMAKGFQAGSLRSCVWTITAEEGRSVQLAFYNFSENNCWPTTVKVYGGRDVNDPGNEIFSLCNRKGSAKTGWKRVTVVFQFLEYFPFKSFGFNYSSYKKEESFPMIFASLNQTSAVCDHRILSGGGGGIGEANPTFTFRVKEGDKPEIIVCYSVHPKVELTHFWLMADSPALTFRWKTTCNDNVCRISSQNQIDNLNGQYTFALRVGQASARVTFRVILEYPPQMHLHTYAASPYQRGTYYRFDCDFNGEPQPEAHWYFYPSNDASTCDGRIFGYQTDWITSLQETLNKSRELKSTESLTNDICQEGFRRLTLHLTLEESGCLFCWTRNTFGYNYKIKSLSVSGPVGELTIVRSESEPIADEMFALTCAASRINYGGLLWTYQKAPNGVAVTQNELEKLDSGITFLAKSTDTTVSSTLRFERLSTEHQGYYTCNSQKVIYNNKTHESRFDTTTGYVHDTFNTQTFLKVIQVPVFVGNSSNLWSDTVSVDIGEGTNATLNCSSRGQKPLRYEWSGVPLGGGTPELLRGQQSELLVVSDGEAREAEAYVCTVTNDAGNITRHFNLRYASNGTSILRGDVQAVWPIALSSAGAVLFVLIVATVSALLLWRKLDRKKTEFVFLSPRRSGPLEVNIPLDVAWEFPDQRLVLGEKIGHGAYGKVVKAHAFGIRPDQDVTTVAVKMLKANADASHKRTLFTELRILIRLGRHLNVVSLLGAVTKYQTLGKLMIIVEFCEKGSLLNLLRGNRKGFVCQVHRDTGRVDKNLCTFPFQEITQEAFGTSNDKRNPVTRTDEVTATSSVHKIQKCVVDELTTPESLFEKASEPLLSTEGEKTATSSVKTTETRAVDQFPNLESLGETATEPSLCTTDLVKFSFQCARGMEYIASRKLVHRDLAARNVLLTKDNIIKICDFGLTRDEIYLYNNVKKGALPIRWMAPESLEQNQFTTKSDVWSFGILLWEMFTLGMNPYPGMPIDHEFYQKIFTGYRLHPPETTPGTVSKLMCDCWQATPGERPNFSEIVERFSDLLEDQERNYYLKLSAVCEAASENRPAADDNASWNSELLLGPLFESDDGYSEQTEDEETSIL